MLELFWLVTMLVMLWLNGKLFWWSSRYVAEVLVRYCAEGAVGSVGGVLQGVGVMVDITCWLEVKSAVFWKM